MPLLSGLSWLQRETDRVDCCLILCVSAFLVGYLQSSAGNNCCVWFLLIAELIRNAFSGVTGSFSSLAYVLQLGATKVMGTGAVHAAVYVLSVPRRTLHFARLKSAVKLLVRFKLPGKWMASAITSCESTGILLPCFPD